VICVSQASGIGLRNNPVVSDPGSDVRVKTANRPYIIGSFVVTAVWEKNGGFWRGMVRKLEGAEEAMRGRK